MSDQPNQPKPARPEPLPFPELDRLRTTCVCGAVHESPKSEALIYHQTVQFFLHEHHPCIERHWLLETQIREVQLAHALDRKRGGL